MKSPKNIETPTTNTQDDTPLKEDTITLRTKLTPYIIAIQIAGVILFIPVIIFFFNNNYTQLYIGLAIATILDTAIVLIFVRAMANSINFTPEGLIFRKFSFTSKHPNHIETPWKQISKAIKSDAAQNAETIYFNISQKSYRTPLPPNTPDEASHKISTTGYDFKNLKEINGQDNIEKLQNLFETYRKKYGNPT